MENAIIYFFSTSFPERNAIELKAFAVNGWLLNPTEDIQVKRKHTV